MTDLACYYRLSAKAAIRSERFGGLAYRYDSRKLHVLHSRLLVDVIMALDNGLSLAEVLDQHSQTLNGVETSREALLNAIILLEDKGIVERVRHPVTALPANDVVGASHQPSSPIASTGAMLASRPSTSSILQGGVVAPICLTWEITYSCNLHCRHCLSSSGNRHANELTTDEAKRLVDEWAAMKVFYVNVGGGEPMCRPDFFELMDYALEHRIGINFSTNGTLIDDHAADWIASRDYLDLQISLEGADAETNDQVRGAGSFARARRAMELLAKRQRGFKVSVVVTRHNHAQLDALYLLAASYGAQLRITRLRPSGRGRDVWAEMRPTRAQNEDLYDWLLAHPDVLTGDSFFHLSALGKPLEGMNMCGAGSIVCCVSPTGDIFACPFMQERALCRGNVRGGFGGIWGATWDFAPVRRSETGGCQACPGFSSCHGGCPAVKYSTGIPADCPDPDCVLGREPHV